jgi:hypothetical protein
MPLRLRIAKVLLAGTIFLATAGPALAQVVHPLENPSARSAAMGGSTTAVVWSVEPNPWANPALLGYASGLTIRWGQAVLFDGSPDVSVGTGGVAFGWGGVGFSYDDDGLEAKFSVTDYREHLRRWGGGISLSRMLETARGMSRSGIARHADLAVGFASKRAKTDPPAFLGPGGTSSATDLGLVARVSPLPGGGDGDGGLSLDFAYGFAVLKEPLDALTYGVTPEHHRHGIGVHLGLPISGTSGGLARRLARGANPILAVTIAADFDRYERPSLFNPQDRIATRSDDLGAELEIASTLALRVGHVRDEGQDLDNFCFGFGIAPPIGNFARVRYDYARFPQGLGAGQGDRHAASVWLDPIGLVRR